MQYRWRSIITTQRNPIPVASRKRCAWSSICMRVTGAYGKLRVLHQSPPRARYVFFKRKWAELVSLIEDGRTFWFKKLDWGGLSGLYFITACLWSPEVTYLTFVYFSQVSTPSWTDLWWGRSWWCLQYEGSMNFPNYIWFYIYSYCKMCNKFVYMVNCPMTSL